MKLFVYSHNLEIQIDRTVVRISRLRPVRTGIPVTNSKIYIWAKSYSTDVCLKLVKKCFYEYFV